MGAAKHDVMEGKEAIAQCLHVRSFVVGNSESESGAASETSLSNSPTSFGESYTDQTGDNTSEQSV